MTALEAFKAEVARFQAWADTIDDQYDVWERDYEDWQPFYSAFTEFITTTPSSQWSVDTVRLLLYSIARDNDCAYLIGELAKSSEQLLFLAEHAMTSEEVGARWQIAAALAGVQECQPQVEVLLLQFAHDQDEYVRRRALSALADRGSKHVEALAEPAWATGNEYQRIMVLSALYRTSSPRLDHYLAEAETDGRKYLLAYRERALLGKKLAAANYQERLGPLQQAAIQAGIDQAIAQQLPPFMDPLDDTWTEYRIAECLRGAGFPRHRPVLKKVAGEIWHIYHAAI